MTLGHDVLSGPLLRGEGKWLVNELCQNDTAEAHIYLLNLYTVLKDGSDT